MGKKEKKRKNKTQPTFSVFPDDDDVKPLESRGHPGGVEAVAEVDVEVESCVLFSEIFSLEKKNSDVEIFRPPSLSLCQSYSSLFSSHLSSAAR